MPSPGRRGNMLAFVCLQLSFHVLQHNGGCRSGARSHCRHTFSAPPGGISSYQFLISVNVEHGILSPVAKYQCNCQKAGGLGFKGVSFGLKAPNFEVPYFSFLEKDE
ncbi:hypothetical protein SLEP1_g39770 [Rubroshorea leprosula]|uniref:Uncharacterized protein n=1 Tax=Rubroshorea leprosula TaxID=152421 RepID=A0AAV5L1P2_9ROSI|nr:hypothetical protein SLEP1_g39770 [Rubroshorea leprosula]